jgi:Flp pilus assembly protein TadD
VRQAALKRSIVLVVAAAFSVTAALAQQAKMYGTVLDEQGQPVANAKVVLEPVEKGSRVEVATKGKKGSFLIGIIRPGTYKFRIDAAGMTVVSIEAKAMNYGKDRKEPVWTKEGRVRSDQPPQMDIEDGMEITCNAVIGKASEVTTATGEKTLASSDQALALLTQQIQKGDCAGAAPQLDKFVAENPTVGRAYYLLGYCDAVLEKDEAALAALAKARELDPGFPGTLTLQGKIFARTKQLPQAEEAFRKELENTNLPVEVQTDALLSLGAVQRDQGKDQDAIASFEKAKALSPSRPEAYVELAGLYSKLGQTDKAAAILEEAKSVGADDPLAMLNVGISYFNKKDYPHAEAMFRRVTESKASNEDLAMAYGLLGKLQLRDGKTDAAVASFKKCLELDPKGRLAAETAEVLKALKK